MSRVAGHGFMDDGAGSYAYCRCGWSSKPFVADTLKDRKAQHGRHKQQVVEQGEEPCVGDRPTHGPRAWHLQSPSNGYSATECGIPSDKTSGVARRYSTCWPCIEGRLLKAGDVA